MKIINPQNYQGFRIYHFAHAGYNEMCKEYHQKEFMNHFPSGNDEYLKKIAESGGAIWLWTWPYKREESDGVKGPWYLPENWQDSIEERVQKLKDDGIWDNVVGFEFDEPMLRTKSEFFIPVSEYLTKFKKRQLAIFSVYEMVEGSHPRSDDPEYGMKAHVINKECCRFLTDIAYDSYGYTSYAYHKLMSEEMKRKVGRNDVYVWFVPCTWAQYKGSSEEHALNHFEVCYKLLKEQETPGGLICYNWRSFRNKGESLDWLFSKENPERWERLEARMIEAGKEIVQIPLKPLR